MKYSLRRFVSLSVFSLYLLSLIIFIFIFNDYNIRYLKNKFLDENKYALDVIKDILDTEKKDAYIKAKIISQDKDIFFAMNTNTIISIKNDENGLTKVVSPVNRIRYLKMLNEINAKLNYSSTPSYQEHNTELFSKEFKSLATNSAIPKQYLEIGNESYLNDIATKPWGGLLAFIDKRNDKYFIKGIDRVMKEGFVEYLGIVIVTKSVDISFITKVKKAVGKDIVLIENGKISLTTLEGNSDLVLNYKIVENIKTDSGIFHSDFILQKEKYGFDFLELRDYDGKIIGYIGAGFNYKEFESVYKDSMKKFLITAIISSLLLLIVLYSVLKYAFRPFNYLLKGVAEIKNGNYSNRINLKAKGELGLLSESIDSLAETVFKREQELIEKNKKLITLDKLKDEFLANTSHELRTPLNGIIGIAETLIEGVAGNLNDKAKSQLKMIVSSGNRLSNLINEILDFSKLKNRGITLNIEKVDVGLKVNGVFELLKNTMSGKNLKLINRIGKEQFFVAGDEDRIEQIFHNIIGNAIKFTDEGEISVSAKIKKDFCEISITDTGIGIPEDKYDTVFESFEQVDGSSTRKYAGTGLGLSVTRKLIELMKGAIWVKSELGKGSTFTFILPIYEIGIEKELHIEYETSVVSEIEDEEDRIKMILEEKKNAVILIVDDESVNLSVLENYLLLRNYNVIKAANGKKALEIVKEHSDRIDLVVLDLMMPDLSGYEVCREIRKDFSQNSLPVLLLTAKNQQEDIVAGFSEGANDYLTKPIKKDEFYARVDTLVTLKESTLKLENQIKDKTKELEEKNKYLEMTLKKLEETQEQLKEAENKVKK